MEGKIIVAVLIIFKKPIFFSSFSLFRSGFGLWLDGDLRFGKSDRCTTFENEPLSKEERFEILKLEVYGLV